MLLNDFENYMQYLATNHLQLLHSTTRKTFYPYGQLEPTEQSTKAASPCIKHVGFTANGTGETLWTYVSTWHIIKEVKTIKTSIEKEVNAARNTTNQIVEDIDGKLWEDFNNGDLCPVISNILDTRFNELGFTDQYAVGWEYTIVFTASKQGFEPTNWVDNMLPFSDFINE